MSTARILDAARFAAYHHRGQTDKSGTPYVEHPLAVAAIVEAMDGTHDEITAALLHDVVEDTPVTLVQVHEQFGPRVAAIVDAVSRRDGEAWKAYLRRIVAAGPSAVRVKLADLTHNMSPSRALNDPHASSRTRMYRHAVAFLEEAAS